MAAIKSIFHLRAQQGFILAATLWTLAIMFIVVGIFHSYVQQKLQVGVQAKVNLQQRLDRHSTEQTLLYLISSLRMTRSGITFSQQSATEFFTEDGLFVSDAVGDELALDGAVYRGINDTHFSLQDQAGLISINTLYPLDLTGLIEKYEANALVRTQLISRLKDYIDANQSISLSGAEHDDYVRQGLLPPTNDYLRTEVELLQVMGWRNWLESHPSVDWQAWFSVRKGSSINLNTMPQSLLVNYLGLSEDLASQLVLERKSNPFRTVADFVARTGLPMELIEEKYRFFPSDDLKVSIWNTGGGQALMISLQLTPNGLNGPWQVDYEYSTQRDNDDKESLAIWQTTLFGHTLGYDR